MKGERFDIHQHITDQIIAAIERGAGEFRLPWHRSAGNIIRPVNIASKKPYRGVNILTLWATADEKGYTAGLWGTYRQWVEAGAQVRKSEKAAYIVFYKEITVASDDDSDEADTRLFARATPVFAAEQVDGYAAPVIDTPATIITPIEQAEAFAARTGATIHHGGTRAFYRPSTDSIQLREAFVGTATSTPAEAYYSTVLHELTHNAVTWIMPHCRCERWTCWPPAMRQFGIIRAPPGKRAVGRPVGSDPAGLSARRRGTEPFPSAACRREGISASYRRTRAPTKARSRTDRLHDATASFDRVFCASL
jgi:antirestriction protein ArdC